jgi:hypothetical protein
MRDTEFKLRYVKAGGSSDSARSYVNYLNRAERLTGDLDQFIRTHGSDRATAWLEGQPERLFGSLRNRRDSLSAFRKYVDLMTQSAPSMDQRGPTLALSAGSPREELAELLADARALGARYYRLTGKPLGVTGEVAELAAAEIAGVELALARQPGFDGWLNRDAQRLRVQIKGRAVDPQRRYVGRCPSILCGDKFDVCLLVLLDRATLEAIEIWEADEKQVAMRLSAPGSKARNERGSLGISQFKSIARKVWPSPI